MFNPNPQPFNQRPRARGPQSASNYMGQSGMGQMQTSISPYQNFYPYSGNLQQQMMNQTLAQGNMPLNYAMKQYDRPGVSRGDANYSAALRDTVGAGQGAAQQAGMDLMGQHDANAQMGLQAAIAQSNEAAGLGQLGLCLQGANIGRQNRIIQPYLSSIEQMFGGLFGAMMG